MATLSILVEAAKLVEYDEDIFKNRKKILAADEQIRLLSKSKQSYPMVQCQKKNSSFARYNDEVRRGNRETHNILEKNRRADMKNYFQILKSNLPKLRDMVKASNVSILTDAVKHIQELTEADRNYQIEKAVLRKCQSNLEERIKLLKEDIRRQHFCAQLFVQVQEEKKRVQDSSSSPRMMSVEIQADENDIKADSESFVRVQEDTKHEQESCTNMTSVEIQANENDIKADAESFFQVEGEEMEPVEEESPPDMMSVEVQANENDIMAEMPADEQDGNMKKYKRSCLSDLRNDFSQNGQSANERLSSPLTKNTRSSQTKAAGPDNCSAAPLACLSSEVNTVVTSYTENSVGVQCKMSKHTTKAVTRRKRKLARENEDTDSDSDLKIILDDE